MKKDYLCVSTVELARKHASKVKQHDEQLSRTLRERQKVFEEAFREQMQNYKRVGRLDGQSAFHFIWFHLEQ